MRGFLNTLLRIPQAIILGFIGAVFVVIGGVLSLIGILIALAMHGILLWLAEFIIQAASINVTFDLARGIWVGMFLVLWLSITIGELSRGTVSKRIPKSDEEIS